MDKKAVKKRPEGSEGRVGKTTFDSHMKQESNRQKKVAKLEPSS